MSGKPEWPPAGTCVAHRGACGTAPENTIVAARAAVDQGARTVEVDVQRSADGELVIVHDSRLGRTSNIAEALPDRAEQTIGELSMAELRKLDAGAWFDRRYRGEPIPTLAEFLEALDGRATLLIEVKSPDRHPGIEQDLAAELTRCLGDRLNEEDLPPVAVQVADLERLRGLSELLPPAVPRCLMTGLDRVLTLDEFGPLGDWVSAYMPLNRMLTAAHVARAHDYGVRIVPWTVDAPEAVATMRDLGADSVITNDVPFVQPVLEGRPSGLARTPLRVESASVPEARMVLRAEADVDTTGWSLRNHLMRRYELPARRLTTGETLELAADSADYLDNYGDTLALYDADDAVVDLYFYREMSTADD